MQYDAFGLIGSGWWPVCYCSITSWTAFGLRIPRCSKKTALSTCEAGWLRHETSDGWRDLQTVSAHLHLILARSFWAQFVPNLWHRSVQQLVAARRELIYLDASGFHSFSFFGIMTQLVWHCPNWNTTCEADVFVDAGKSWEIHILLLNQMYTSTWLLRWCGWSNIQDLH